LALVELLLNIVEKLDYAFLQLVDLLLLRLKPDHKQLQVFWKPVIERHEIAPLPACAS
jgi:hypothetical protein